MSAPADMASTAIVHVFDLDFDLQRERSIGSGVPHDITGSEALRLHRGDVVVLDQDAIREGHTVIVTATHQDAVLVQHPETGKPFCGYRR